MLKRERFQFIMDRIREQQNVRVRELKDALHVSDETIRRDLAELEQQGFLRCVHGGAVYDSSTTNEYRVEVRIQNNPLEKEAICREAARLVKDGQSLEIAASTTTLPLGKHLAEKNNLMVVTNSIPLAHQIAANETNRVILTGGNFWSRDQKLMGPMTVQAFRRFRADLCFFSVSGISRTEGVTEYAQEESEVVRAVMEAGREKILLNDSTKFEVVAFNRLCEAGNLDRIITDWHIAKNELACYTSMGIRVTCAARPAGGEREGG